MHSCVAYWFTYLYIKESDCRWNPQCFCSKNHRPSKFKEHLASANSQNDLDIVDKVFRYWLILKEQKKNRNLLGGFFPKKRRIPLGCGDFYLALPSCYLFGYLFMVQMQIFVVFLLQAECSAIYSGWFGKRSSASFKSCKLDAVWSGIGRCY